MEIRNEIKKKKYKLNQPSEQFPILNFDETIGNLQRSFLFKNDKIK